jgi:hypothetical protein
MKITKLGIWEISYRVLIALGCLALARAVWLWIKYR